MTVKDFYKQFKGDPSKGITEVFKGRYKIDPMKFAEAYHAHKLAADGDLADVSECHEATVAEYWHQRCKKAEAYINESPCDPDITDSQLKAWREYQDFIAE